MKAARGLIGVAGNRLLLDTNAIIALQRNAPGMVALVQGQAEIYVSSIAIGELFFGAYKSARSETNRETVRTFAAGRAVLSVDTHTGDFYGLIKQALRAKGRPIPENDIWIAAHALQYDCTLVTDDAHFTEIDGLRTQKW